VNLLLVNPVHPETAHISAVRAWRFAEELARRGHRVVLLSAHADGLPADGIAAARDLLRAHDWTRPLVLPVACAPDAAPRLPGLLRRAETAVRLLLRGGLQGTWVRRATILASGLGPAFRPDVIWTTFGRLESVVVARRIARRLRVPWVLDLKDKWELFIPPALRRLVALRTRGWSAVTANSTVNIAQAARWHRGRADLIYSGVDAPFLAARETPPDRERFVVNLVGSLYFPQEVERILLAMRLWSEQLPAEARDRVALHYLGGDGAMLRDGYARAGLGFPLVEHGYLAPAALATACRRAAVNAYVAYPGSFHHKLLELLACARPVVAFPGESDEARMLAADVGGQLLVPTDPASLAGCLDTLHRRWLAGEGEGAAADAGRYSWSAQAALLEETLARVAKP
jgi:glycosyltransferase involved in cell wall biosynthesis